MQFNSIQELTARDLFQTCVCDRVQKLWKEDSLIDEKWKCLKTALAEPGESTKKRKHADWFRESENVLKPLLDERNRMYSQWLTRER